MPEYFAALSTCAAVSVDLGITGLASNKFASRESVHNNDRVYIISGC